MTTNVGFCIYDNSALAYGVTVAAGGMCGSSTCWKQTGKGFKYKNLSGQIAKMSLKGDASKGKLLIKGKGAALAAPTIPMGDNVLVQFVKSDGPECWEVDFGNTALLNDGVTFKDKTP